MTKTKQQENFKTEDLSLLQTEKNVCDTLEAVNNKTFLSTLSNNEILKMVQDKKLEAIKHKIEEWMKIRNQIPSMDSFEFQEVGLDDETKIKIPPFIVCNSKSQYYIKRDLLVDYILSKYHIFVVENVLYIYEEGYYKRSSPKKIGMLIKKELPNGLDLFNPTLDNYITHSIMKDQRVVAPAEILSLEVRYINCKNGLFDTVERKLIEHTPSIFTFSQLKGNYDNSKKSVIFESFFETLVPDRDSRKTIWQIAGLGYSLYNVKNGHLLMSGDSDSGKSVLFKSFFTLPLSKDMVVATSFEQLTKKDSEYVVTLRGKTVNVSGEMSPSTSGDLSQFKSLCDGELIETRGLYENATELANTATFVFASNLPPMMNEASASISNRINYIYVKKNYQTHEKDELLLDKIFLFDIDYIITKAINSLGDVLDNGMKVFVSEEIKKCSARYTKSTDSVVSFVEDLCVINKGAYISPSLFTDIYNAYCLNELDQKSKRKREIMNIIRERYKVETSEDRDIRIPKTRFKGWKGIMIDPAKISEFDWYSKLDSELKEKLRDERFNLIEVN